MKQLSMSLLVLGLLFMGCGGPRPGRKPGKTRLFQCRRAMGKIVIDGKLDEPAWDRAQLVEDFRVPELGAKPLAPTMARLLWDDRFLYVAVTMEDRDIYAAVKKHDGMTWHDDVAEVFLKPSEHSNVYHEFHCTPLGTTLDLMIARRGAGHFDRWWPWESGFQAKASVQGTVNEWRDRDKGWIVEMAIPLAAFKDAAPKVQLGDRWRFAVCRYNYSVHMPGGLERTSSAPLTKMDFHRYEDFDEIEFAE